MSKKYIELKKEDLIFEGKTEKEKKINEMIYDLCLENDALYEENKNLMEINEQHCKLNGELRKENQELKSNLDTITKSWKLNVKRVKELNNILTEIEKWLENELFNKTQIYALYSLGLRKCYDKLQELKWRYK